MNNDEIINLDKSIRYYQINFAKNHDKFILELDKIIRKRWGWKDKKKK